MPFAASVLAALKLENPDPIIATFGASSELAVK
jgi:hypothetical protein